MLYEFDRTINTARRPPRDQRDQRGKVRKLCKPNRRASITVSRRTALWARDLRHFDRREIAVGARQKGAPPGA
jgi:hypothetical protein